jgi:hypothetical protein
MMDVEANQPGGTGERVTWLQHTRQVLILHTKDAELSRGWNAFS